MKETFLFLHMKAIYLDALPPRDQSSGEQLYESNKLTSPIQESSIGGQRHRCFQPQRCCLVEKSLVMSRTA
jgi:hypothetical protein